MGFGRILIEFCNFNAVPLTAIATIITAIVTSILAWLTSRYVKLTGRMVDEMVASRYPVINVNLETPDRGYARLVIHNAGLSAGHEISLSVVQGANLLLSFPGSQHNIVEYPPFKNQISHLPPGKQLKYMCFINVENHAYNGIIEVQIAYKNASGMQFHSTAKFDLANYNNLLYESFADGDDRIAFEIREFRKESNANRRSSSFNSSNLKCCCRCKEFIQYDALLCKWCGSEQIQKQRLILPSNCK